MNDIALHIGTPADMGQRFVAAWRRADAGETVAETHLTFSSLEALLAALTPKRLAMLRLLHAEPQDSVRALARRLQRDYHRVHADVVALELGGLVRRERHQVTAPFDVLRAELRMAEGGDRV